MGKQDEELSSLSTSGNGVSSDTGSSNVERECRVSGFFGLKCVLILLLGIAVFLPAIFWLPPFSKLADLGDRDRDPRFPEECDVLRHVHVFPNSFFLISGESAIIPSGCVGHDIVASFKLEKPISFLEDNIDQLALDIFDEIEVPNTKVVILSLDSSPGSNITDVVFAVEPEKKNTRISSAARSLIRASFVSLVIRQSSLQLTTSMFGEPYFFEVLKFVDGITVTPSQPAFLLQKSQISFNFTLNFSIYQLQANFVELKSQLKSGLHLASYENLYVSLSNTRGSTVVPPATVQANVWLAVGIAPSKPRLKQLAKTIKDSHGGNLGLNNTVFGRVKQISLSSILQHSLGGDGISPAPAPAPVSLPHHHHHHHHHHPHGRHQAPSMAPSSLPFPRPAKGSPSPKRSPSVPERAAPAPGKGNEASPPGCGYGYKRRPPSRTPIQYSSGPVIAPSISPHPFVAPPHPHVKPSPSYFHHIPPSSPLPSVIFAHAHPPRGSEPDSRPKSKVPSDGPAPSTSAAATAFLQSIHWEISLFLALLLHL